MFICVSTLLHTHLCYCISLTLPAGVSKVKYCCLLQTTSLPLNNDKTSHKLWWVSDLKNYNSNIGTILGVLLPAHDLLLFGRSGKSSSSKYPPAEINDSTSHHVQSSSIRLPRVRSSRWSWPESLGPREMYSCSILQQRLLAPSRPARELHRGEALA